VTLSLIDSSALLALVDASDTHHLAAVNFIRTHIATTFYLPDTIFSETMVLTKARLGIKPAVDLGERLKASSHFQIVYLTPEDHQLIWEIFSRYLDKDWSYIDCSLLALARRLKVSEVFTFDHHFSQMPEITRVP
jgi:predicted nucleic acid-binding protein